MDDMTRRRLWRIHSRLIPLRVVLMFVVGCVPTKAREEKEKEIKISIAYFMWTSV